MPNQSAEIGSLRRDLQGAGKMINELKLKAISFDIVLQKIRWGKDKSLDPLFQQGLQRQ